jgi:threonine synthase
MNDPIRYYSTNRSAPQVSLRRAVLTGQAPDRGLYMPDRFPQIPTDELVGLAELEYPAIANAVLRRFTEDEIDEPTLLRLCEDAYDFDVPLEHVTARRHLMRLDRGPTASFKDFAARMMARWMGEFTQTAGHDLLILTATSGDTGSAVAHAYHGVDRVRVLVLFPINEVSDRQRKQMTTIGGNVTTVAVEGKFDDCQAMVKQAFADPDLVDLHLTSANSINIARLLPQAVYYVYAYVKLADVRASERMVVCVPSGNFGDMMGAIIAREMGLRIERIVIATNANDEVPKFLDTGEYQKIVPSRVCISNAMNVGHPSNLARLVDVYGGWMDETGNVRKRPDFDRMRRDLYAISIDDDATRRTIKEAYDQYGTVLEPHGAVGWAGLERFFDVGQTNRDQLAVSIETAHPAKFPDEIRAILDLDPEVPPSLAGLEDHTESFDTIPAAYAPFRDMLLTQFRV